jgi:hypothetical protein
MQHGSTTCGDVGVLMLVQVEVRTLKKFPTDSQQFLYRHSEQNAVGSCTANTPHSQNKFYTANRDRMRSSLQLS